jgi:HTH-type transcriptional regulator / antitoxin HigA
MSSQMVVGAWNQFIMTSQIKRPENESEYQQLLELTDDLTERYTLSDPKICGLVDLLFSYISDWENHHQPSINAQPNEVLEELMLEQNLTQTALANALSISQGVLSRVLSGEREISKTLALKLAAYFRVSIELFLV